LKDDYASQLDFRIIQNWRHEAVKNLKSGQYNEAEALLLRVAEKSYELYASDYYWRKTTRIMIVKTYWEQQKWDEAEKLLLQIGAEQAQTDRPRKDADTKHKLAQLSLAKRDYDRA
jgi:hypothetical protein